MALLEEPIRGLRQMTFAVALVLLRYLLELALAVVTLVGGTLGLEWLVPDVATLLWAAAYLRLLDVAALGLLALGVLGNVGEAQRRRQALTPVVVALGAFALALLIQLWMYGLLTEVADAARHGGSGFRRFDDIARIPGRVFAGNVAYLGGLFATVLLVRGYAITDGNLGVREGAREIGGMLVVLLIADTFYRFTYGLGGSIGLGMGGLVATVGLGWLWFWCHRRLGSLFDTARYYLRESAHVPVAAVREPGSRRAVAPAPAVASSAAVPAPAAVPATVTVPVAPTAPAAPASTVPIAARPASAAPAADERPRFLGGRPD